MRRAFITLLGGVGAWPLAARAQQGERMPRIGVLGGGSDRDAGDPEAKARLAAFLQGLRQSGWSVSDNLQIDYRRSAGDAEQLRKDATELAALKPEVILATGSPTVAALQQATRSVPIVFVRTSDPVGDGFVDSLARPGGNTTGFMSFEYSLSGKWLELLKEIAPAVTRVAVMADPTNVGAVGQVDYEREKSACDGKRPCGVYLSTAFGSSRESLASNSSRDNPVCCVKLFKTSGPIACSSCDGVTGLFGPVPTQESAVSPWPFCLKRSTSSPIPPLKNPPALAPPPRLLFSWPNKPPRPPCPAPAVAVCPAAPSISAILSLF
jgi:hypothetical protein